MKNDKYQLDTQEHTLIKGSDITTLQKAVNFMPLGSALYCMHVIHAIFLAYAKSKSVANSTKNNSDIETD